MIVKSKKTHKIHDICCSHIRNIEEMCEDECVVMKTITENVSGVAEL